MKTVFENPLLNRYIRSRLRWRKSIFWYALVLIGCAFAVSIVIVTETQRMGLELRDGARAALVPLVIIQGILLLFMGTGAVATGITKEKVEDVLDYQRMTPMRPLSNILGYLVGLPIREYVLFGLTLPFLLFVVIAGALNPLQIGIFYLVLLLSALLYHATGLAAGLVSRQWRWSGRVAQVLVVVLYFILPQFSHVGIVSFEYLTVRPVFADTIYPLLRELHEGVRVQSEGTAMGRLAGQPVPFYTLRLSGTLYSILLQGGFLILLLSMSLRKWLHPEGPSMSKKTAAVVFGSVVTLTLGNLWPLMTGDPGRLEVFLRGEGLIDEESLYVALPMVLGFLLLFVGVFLLHIVATNEARFRRGQIRMRRWGWRRLPRVRDEASALWVTGLFSVIVSGVLSLMFPLLSASYPPDPGSGVELGKQWLLVFGIGLVYFQFTAIREWLGEERLYLWLLLFWGSPLLVAIILGAAQDQFGNAALWLTGLSPLSLLPLGSLSLRETLIMEEAAGILNFSSGRNFAFFAQTVITAVLLVQRWRIFGRLRSI